MPSTAPLVSATGPRVVRYVEMSRSAETYQEERFASEIVGFVDVIGSLLGARMHWQRGCCTMGDPPWTARSGLQMCAALDATGGCCAVARIHVRAFIKGIRKDDNTVYDEASVRGFR